MDYITNNYHKKIYYNTIRISKTRMFLNSNY